MALVSAEGHNLTQKMKKIMFCFCASHMQKVNFAVNYENFQAKIYYLVKEE